jgi:predicted transcriptional regulator
MKGGAMHRLIISLTDELWQALRALAYETEQSYTEIMRQALEAWADKRAPHKIPEKMD